MWVEKRYQPIEVDDMLVFASYYDEHSLGDRYPNEDGLYDVECYSASTLAVQNVYTHSLKFRRAKTTTTSYPLLATVGYVDGLTFNMQQTYYGASVYGEFGHCEAVFSSRCIER